MLEVAMNELKTEMKPLVISRVFAAPREMVFAAWSTAEHLKNWFSPEGCSVPKAEVEFRASGVFAFTMRLPDGEEHEARGHFVEIDAPARLVFAQDVIF